MVDLPPTHPVQALSDAVHHVIVTQTPAGLDIGRYPRPTVAVDDQLTHPGLPRTAATFDGLRDRIILAGPVPAATVRAAELVGSRWSMLHEQAAALLIHEHLHATTAGRAARFSDAADQGVEEAAVDAVAADIAPQVTAALTTRPTQLAEASHYPRCVARVRVASTVATHSATWRDAAAAGWRMRLLLSLPDERRAMLTATGTHPAEVCS